MNPHQVIPETDDEKRRANKVTARYIAESRQQRRESGLIDQRYLRSPSNLYQLIARKQTGVTVNSHVPDHITRTYDKLKVERYMDELWDRVFNSSKFPPGSAMSLSTVALTTIVSATIHHILSDTDGFETALPRPLREWNLSDSRSAAAATGWAKGK